MKNLTPVLSVFWLGFWVPVLALPPVTVRDINADGVKETIYCHPYVGGNHVWLAVRIVCQGKTVFYSDKLPADYGDCRVLEIDSRSAGEEVVTMECWAVERYLPREKWEPNYFKVEIWGWDTKLQKYQIRWSIGQTLKRYKPWDFEGVLRDLPTEKVKYFPVLAKAASFIQAVKSRDWVKVKSLLDPSEDAPTLEQIKGMAKIIAILPPSDQWYLSLSPHDPTCFVITIFVPEATDGAYTIVVNPKGINKFFPGKGD